MSGQDFANARGTDGRITYAKTDYARSSPRAYKNQTIKETHRTRRNEHSRLTVFKCCVYLFKQF